MGTAELTLRAIEPEDLEALQELVDSDPRYIERVTGLPPGDSEVQSLLLARPPDTTEEQKFVLGAWAGDRLLAVVDVIRGWPEPNAAHIGLLQVHWVHQREGLGRRVHELLLEVVRGWPEVTRLRATVVATNAVVAEPFWRAMGYSPQGGPRPYRYANLETMVQTWTRAV